MHHFKLPDPIKYYDDTPQEILTIKEIAITILRVI